MRKKILFIAIIIVVIAIIFVVAIPLFKSKEPSLTISGRIEADEIELSTRISGRVKAVLIEDGMEIKKGDEITKIEDKEFQLQRREISKTIDQLTQKIQASESEVAYTAKTVENTIDEARKYFSDADARLKQAQAKKDNTDLELKRYSGLQEKGVVTKQQFDNMKQAHQLSEEEVKVSQKEVERANVSLMKAEDAQNIIKVKEKDLEALKKSLGQLTENLNQIDITIGYTTITAPVNGIILKKLAEPGDVFRQGGVIAIMVDLKDIHGETYIPEKYIGNIHLDMKAKIFAEAYPDHPFTGRVCYMADKAEFIPREFGSYEEIGNKGFAVKICFSEDDSPEYKGRAYHEILKKGMPVDVKFEF